MPTVPAQEFLFNPNWPQPSGGVQSTGSSGTMLQQSRGIEWITRHVVWLFTALTIFSQRLQ